MASLSGSVIKICAREIPLGGHTRDNILRVRTILFLVTRHKYIVEARAREVALGVAGRDGSVVKGNAA